MMKESIDLKELKKNLAPFSLLYVEDNTELQEKAATFFGRLFTTMYRANNGEEGLRIFKAHKPSIVITDIQMPIKTGLEMAHDIHEIEPQTKIIVTSAYDEKEYLLKGISLGISGYLVKPLKAEEITSLLWEIAHTLNEERNKNLFNTYLYSIFNNQQSLLIMLKGENVALANEQALSFFETKSLKDFREKFKLFDTYLLRHDSFLYYQADGRSCLERVKQDIDRLYNVKITDKTHTPHHFILRLTAISDTEELYILSLTDISELNLLALYDKNALDHDIILKDEKTVTSLLQAAKEAGAVIKVYNFYKGLVVSNNAVITYSNRDLTAFKTSLLQQKAIQYEKKVIFNSELFPYDIQSDDIKEVYFHNQTVDVGKCTMLKTTPVERKYLILEPHSKHKVNLFYDNHHFNSPIKLINISIESARISLEYLPAGFKIGDDIVLDMVFSDGIKPIIINTKAKVYKLFSIEKTYNVVANFILTSVTHKLLIDYMASRQMQLVREFKGLQYEK